MTTSSAQRRFRCRLAAAVVATSAFAAWIGWHIGGDRSALVVSDAGQAMGALMASAACLRAAGRHTDRRRRFWVLLGAACGAWLFGQIAYTAYDLGGSGGPPIPSWADLGYLAFIGLAVGALLSHDGTRGYGARRGRLLLDGLAVAVALLFLSWTFVLGPLWRSSDLSTLGGVVTLAYPFGDVVIAFFVVLAVQRMTTADRAALWCLLAGLIALAVADSAYAYVVQVQRYTTGNPLDTGWVAGFLAIALGAGVADGHDLQACVEARVPVLPSLVAPLLPMLIALGVIAVSINLGHRPDGVALTMAFALIALALARQTLLLVDFFAAARRGGEGNAADRLASAALGEHGELEPSPSRLPKGSSP